MSAEHVNGFAVVDKQESVMSTAHLTIVEINGVKAKPGVAEKRS